MVRFPNYFGEMVFWFGVWISAISAYQSLLLADLQFSIHNGAGGDHEAVGRMAQAHDRAARAFGKLVIYRT